MCYAIPGKVIQINDNIAKIDYFGEVKRAFNEIEGLKIGDYIYAQGGYIIKRLARDEAFSILSVWKETFFELQEIDLRLSRLDLKRKGVDRKLLLILDKAAEEVALKEREWLYLLNLQKEEELKLLFKVANFLRQKYLKNSCCVHGIIEFSNYCAQACAYCGISSQNIKQLRYRMTEEEIYDAAKGAVEKFGFQALVLQSGEDSGRSIAELVKIVAQIKKRHAVLIFISCGEIGLVGLQKLYAAGARGLLMRFETSNPNLYQKLHPGRKLESRLDHIKAAYEMGYLILTGGLIGLPGQTKEDLLKDIYLAKELKAEMYTFGPFLPHPDTVLKKYRAPFANEVLKVLAVGRLIDAKNAKILVSTGFETLDKNARQLGLMAGANSVMLNVTPKRFQKHYSIYPDRAHENEPVKKQIETTLSLLRKIGRSPTDLGAGR
jgi:biotin synthase